jgi:hypothetical protein
LEFSGIRLVERRQKMRIHALSQYLGTASITAQRTIGAATLSGIAQQASTSNPGKQGDAMVNISPEARRLEETGLPGWVLERIEKLNANPDQNDAMRFVEMMATIPSIGGPLVSVPDEYGRQFYSYTGELVTPEDWQRYMDLGMSSSIKTAEIFRTEKAKGSSAAEIFEKIQQHMATLPDDFLRTLDWFRPVWAR